jgi:hypothetical protein
MPVKRDRGNVTGGSGRRLIPKNRAFVEIRDISVLGLKQLFWLEKIKYKKVSISTWLFEVES